MSKKDEALKLAQDLRTLADRFSEGWHDGIKIDASDIVLLSDAAEALAEQPAQQEPYCYTYTENGEEYFAPPMAYVPDDAKPLYTSTQSQQEPEYAWPTVADYERDVGFQTNEAFRIAWNMARTTNRMLGHASSQPAQQEPVERGGLRFYTNGAERQYWKVDGSIDFKDKQGNVTMTIAAGPITSPQPSKPTDEMVVAAARVLSDRQAAACNVDCGDMWKLHGNDFIDDARAALEAAQGIKENT